MAFCINCGQKIANEAKFCAKCGMPVNEISKDDNIRKVIYDGKIYKCPQCGETLDAFVSNCPSCGLELRGANATGSVRELASKLEEIETKREYKKQNSSFRTLVFNENFSKTDEQKISLIRSFAIPNTKEDLYEFLVLSKTNIEIDLYENTGMKSARLAISDAWKAKFEQAYYKAKLVFKDDIRMAEIQDMYNEINKSIHKAKWKIWKILIIAWSIIIVLIIVGYIFAGNDYENGEISENKIYNYSPTNSEKDIQTFTEGYEKANFTKFNSPAIENGLKGTKIYIQGILKKTEILETSESNVILGFIEDDEKNTWLAELSFIPIVTENEYDSAINNSIVCNVVYSGFSNKYEMPVVVLDEMLVLDSGEKFNGMQKLLDE